MLLGRVDWAVGLGNPLCCAGALAVFEEFAEGQLLARARSL
jgi:adenosylmethionine-8-amino-7-oxononanoate aminotransferase